MFTPFTTPHPSEEATVRTSASRGVAFAAAIAVLAGSMLVAGPVASASADPASCRSIPSDADIPLRADLAKLDFGVDGTGVKVGIISDSIAGSTTAGSSLGADIAAGLLPGPGNPCGRTQPIQIYADRTDPQATDEGRGMAQIVHGIAPGATILFHGSDDHDPANVARAIDELVAAGADIIVDDDSSYFEPYLQQSLPGNAIQAAVERGVTYVSAAGNENVLPREPRAGQQRTPIGSWQTGAYRPATCPDAVVAAVREQRPTGELDCMNFDQTGGTDTSLGFTARLLYSETGWVFQWGEPTGGQRADFLPVALVDGEPGGQLEALPAAVPGYRLIFPTDVERADLEMYVVRISDPANPATLITPAITLQTIGGAPWLYSAEYWQSAGDDLIGATAVAHNNAADSIAVAAAPVSSPFVPETFSSTGPTRLYLTPQTADGSGGLLSAPEVLSTPTIMGVDAIRNTVLGSEVSGQPGVLSFTGTSAAAPSVAAVLALAKQANPALTPDAARDLISRTAQSVESPYYGVPAQDVVGAGLIDARAAVQAALDAVPVPAPDGSSLAHTGVEPSPTAGWAALGLFVVGLLLIGVRYSRARSLLGSQQG